MRCRAPQEVKIRNILRGDPISQHLTDEGVDFASGSLSLRRRIDVLHRQRVPVEQVQERGRDQHANASSTMTRTLPD